MISKKMIVARLIATIFAIIVASTMILPHPRYASVPIPMKLLILATATMLSWIIPVPSILKSKGDTNGRNN